MKKNGTVRLVSISLSIFVILLGALFYSIYRSNKYEKALETLYTRSFYDFYTSLEKLNSSLQNTLYSSQGSEIQFLSDSDKCAAEAIGYFSMLPLADVRTDSIVKFLAQGGDYLSSLVRNRGSLSETDKENLKAMLSHSEQLLTLLSKTEQKIFSRELSITHAQNAIADGPMDNPSQFSAAFKDIENEFKTYIPLNYHGALSDESISKISVFLKDKPEISQEKARQIASSILRCEETDLSFLEETQSGVPAYVFKLQGFINNYIEITKQGGYLAVLVADETPDTSILSQKDGQKIAASFLKEVGFQDMQMTKSEIDGNSLSLEFCATADDFILCPDRISMKISLKTGGIIIFSAREYLKNHQERDLNAAPLLSKDDAKMRLNASLVPVSYKKCVIKTQNGQEALCYDFEAKTADNRLLHIFINAQTGIQEEKYGL